MYSKEDRERILADLDASGLPAAVFAKLPGNPSRNSLSGWRRQAEAGELDVPVRDVRGRCERSRHERYPEAAKHHFRIERDSDYTVPDKSIFRQFPSRTDTPSQASHCIGICVFH